MSIGAAFYPGRPAIDAYGHGGFRFADMSHRGSLLIIASGVYDWLPTTYDDITPQSFEPIFGEINQIEFLLLGTGEEQFFPAAEIKAAFEDHKIGLEVMTTGAACRTYNVLLAEERGVAAALIAVQ